MGYFTRVFCTRKGKPKIQEILDSLNSDGYDTQTNLAEHELIDKNWSAFELYYDSDRLPLLIELNEIDSPTGIAKDEIKEFLEFIGKPGFFNSKKKKVISHLKNTNYIVCIQLPTSDINDMGYDVNGELMYFIGSNYRGMVQADREGFYKDNKLILEIE